MIFDEGNAFKLEEWNGKVYLLTAPRYADGRAAGEDDWSEVDFFSISDEDKAYCSAIKRAL